MRATVEFAALFSVLVAYLAITFALLSGLRGPAFDPEPLLIGVASVAFRPGSSVECCLYVPGKVKIVIVGNCVRFEGYQVSYVKIRDLILLGVVNTYNSNCVVFNVRFHDRLVLVGGCVYRLLIECVSFDEVRVLILERTPT